MSLEILVKLYYSLFSTFTVCVQKFFAATLPALCPGLGQIWKGPSKGQNSAAFPPTCLGDYLVILKDFSKNFITVVRMTSNTKNLTSMMFSH